MSGVGEESPRLIDMSHVVSIQYMQIKSYTLISAGKKRPL